MNGLTGLLTVAWNLGMLGIAAYAVRFFIALIQPRTRERTRRRVRHFVIVFLVYMLLSGSCYAYLENVNADVSLSLGAPVPTPTPMVAQEEEPEQADGSGEAGMTALFSKMHTAGTTGWQVNYIGRWYAVDEVTCYYNGWKEIEGELYHFTAEGYVDTGWVEIDGTMYRFDDDGVCDVGADVSKLVALTFDDGPGPYTSTLLDILEENGCVATFMMLGSQVEKYGSEVIPRMIAMGCQLGNHSYSHAKLSDGTVAEMLAEFAQTDELIAQYNDGVGASVVRFPYGSYTTEEVAALDKASIYWSIDTQDWSLLDAEKVAEVLLTTMYGGAIVLMHDIHETTVEACAIAIPQLMEEGYRFVTLDELAEIKGYTLEAATTYFSFSDDAIAGGYAFK